MHTSLAFNTEPPVLMIQEEGKTFRQRSGFLGNASRISDIRSYYSVKLTATLGLPHVHGLMQKNPEAASMI